MTQILQKVTQGSLQKTCVFSTTDTPGADVPTDTPMPQQADRKALKIF